MRGGYSFRFKVKFIFTRDNAPIEDVRGFEREGTQGKVFKLRRALYGTKQAANAWQKHISSIFLPLCVFMWREGKAFLYIGTHVDDFFVLYNQAGRRIRDKVMAKIRETMEIAEKGEISFALNMKIERDREKGILKISQPQYIEDLLREYNAWNEETKETPSPLTDISERSTRNTRRPGSRNFQ